MKLYDLTMTAVDGREIALSAYRGQTLLVVNTASRCGFTPQLADLEHLYRKYRAQDFTVLGFPCNQFHGQEPGSDGEVLDFCQSHYNVTFPLFAKIDVNGPNAAPLFTLLKQGHPFRGFDRNHPLGVKLDEILSAEDPHYESGNDVKWNFTKFLVSREGDVVARFEPTADCAQVEQAIQRELAHQ